jgi:hypothetical protein
MANELPGGTSVSAVCRLRELDIISHREARVLLGIDRAASPDAPAAGKASDEQVAHMVARFLTWKLPQDFNPDGGISFERVANAGTIHEYLREPVGTNLLDAAQAEAMVRHIIEGVPPSYVAASAA